MRISDWSSDVCSSDLGALFDRRGRDGQPGYLARRARLLAEVLHRRGQLRSGRQQHADLLRARPDEVSALHPQPEATSRFRSEEHTSELQSLMRISYAVFCLKKKQLTRNKLTRKFNKQ